MCSLSTLARADDSATLYATVPDQYHHFTLINNVNRSSFDSFLGYQVYGRFGGSTSAFVPFSPVDFDGARGCGTLYIYTSGSPGIYEFYVRDYGGTYPTYHDKSWEMFTDPVTVSIF